MFNGAAYPGLVAANLARLELLKSGHEPDERGYLERSDVELGLLMSDVEFGRLEANGAGEHGCRNDRLVRLGHRVAARGRKVDLVLAAVGVRRVEALGCLSASVDSALVGVFSGRH